MEIIKKATSREVYSAIKDNRQQAIYNQLIKMVPAESAFLAELKLSNTGPSWIHPESGWKCYTECDEELKGLISGEIMQRKITLRRSVTSNPQLSKVIDDIVICPGEDFYFYRMDEVGQIEVLLTGWGFKKPITRDPAGVVITDPRDKVQSTSIRFVDYGQTVTHRDFQLKLPTSGRIIDRTTDDEGLFLIGDEVLVGTTYVVTDKNTGKTFTIEVIKGQAIYDCDVTLPKPSKIAFVNEGRREVNRKFFLTKDGQQSECTTDGSGIYELGDHLEAGNTYQLIDKETGREFTCTIVEGQELYEFDVTVKGQSVSIAFVSDGKRAGVRKFTLAQVGAETKQMQTEPDSSFKIGDKIETGAQFHIKDIETEKEFDLTVIDGKVLYEFDVTTEKPVAPEKPVVPEPEKPRQEEPEKMVKIRILDTDGALVPGLPVKVEISKGCEVHAETDSEGCIKIPVSKFIPGKKFKVSFNYDKSSNKGKK